MGVGLGGVLVAAAIVAGALPSGPPLPAAVLPKTVRPGEVFVVRPAPGAAAPAAALFLDHEYPPLSVPGEAGPVFLLGVDLDTVPGSESITVRRADGSVELLPIGVVKHAFPEERLKLPPAMVTPPKELEERIAREQALAAALYRSTVPVKLWDRGFTAPLSQRAAGNFGRRRILNGIPKSPHTGQDYTAPAGTPVKAIGAGSVRLVRDFYYSGLTVFVDHGAGLVSVYMHLETALVTEGESVGAGQTVGLVGSTGRATGAHLHLGVRLFEQRVDPESLWGLFPKRGGR